MLTENINNLPILMLFFGFVIAVCLNSLTFYYWGRVTSFLYYSIFVLAVGVFAGLLGGVTEFLPFSLSERSFYWSREVTSSIFSIAYLLFARAFLNTNKLYPEIDRLALITILILAIFPNYYSGDWVFLTIAVNTLNASTCLTLAYLAWLEYNKGKHYTLYMMLSTILMALTFFGDAFSYALNLSSSEVSVDEYIAGNRLLILYAISAVEMLLFSTSIAGLFRQIQKQKEQIEQKSQIRLRFFSAASHDIRQPLYALRSFNTALMQADDPELIKILSQKIDYSVNTMNQLFDSLLVSTRLEAGVEKICNRKFLISEMLTRLKSEFSILARKRSIRLKIQSSKLLIETDQLLLERILRNLLSNAINHMNKESGGIVELSIEEKNKELLFSVRDNGQGLNKEQIDHAFDEFSRFENSHQPQSQGSGLGLFIVKQTASLLDCEISMKSRPGEGSIFILSFKGNFHPQYN